MRWFGESWGAPVCDEECIATPAGQTCVGCQEEIQEGDQGFELPFWDGRYSDEIYYHKDCFLASIGIRPG